jgi:hypothetical protein
MTPITYPLSIYRGDTYRWRFSLWQDTAKTVPVDLVGATAKAEIRAAPAGAVLATLACTIVAPNNVDVVLSSAVSKALTAGVWDLQLTMGNGDIQTPVAGGVSVTPDVTDSTGTTALMSERLSRVS